MSRVSFFHAVASGLPGVPGTPGTPVVPNNAPFDSDAQGFIDAASLSNAVHKQAVNQLVIDLKSSGLWMKMIGIYPFVGGSALSHQFNLKDPRSVAAAYFLTYQGTPTHTANGVRWNANSYAHTGFNFASISPASQHISYYTRVCYSYGGEMGSITQSSGIYDGFFLRGGVIYYYLSDYANVTAGTTSNTGYFIGSRIGDTRTMFQNGAVIGTFNTATPATSAAEIVIGSANGQNSNTECQFATIGVGLTNSEALALRNIVQTYQTSLGRQI